MFLSRSQRRTAAATASSLFYAIAKRGPSMTCGGGRPRSPVGLRECTPLEHDNIFFFEASQLYTRQSPWWSTKKSTMRPAHAPRSPPQRSPALCQGPLHLPSLHKGSAHGRGDNPSNRPTSQPPSRTGGTRAAGNKSATRPGTHGLATPLSPASSQVPLQHPAQPPPAPARLLHRRASKE